MRYTTFKLYMAVMALSTSVGCVAALAQAPSVRGVGRPATQEDIGNAAWSSGASGKDLPPGKGTAKDAMPVYYAKCAMCHGANLEGKVWTPGSLSPISGNRLGGGTGVPVWNRPPGLVVTLAYQVPWATVIFNTIAVEMPMFNPGTLKADEVYGITALVLFKNGLIKEDDVMDREPLPKVQMPNRNAFPASDEIYLDMKKRGCWKTFGDCRDQ